MVSTYREYEETRPEQQLKEGVLGRDSFQAMDDAEDVGWLSPMVVAREGKTVILIQGDGRDHIEPFLTSMDEAVELARLVQGRLP